ncbi:hypothetical protein G6F40_016439 [Rhizopus arrhizus]|nr:hypothetical protein G6F40_016439 [Rhizopus arrhizus]
MVALAQFVHHELADLDRGHFALAADAQLVNHRAHCCFDFLFGHGALLQRAVESGAHLALVEGLAGAIILDDGRQLQLDRFQGAEAFVAGFALTPTTDRRAVFGDARVDDPGIGMLAEGAIHGTPGSREDLRPRSWQRRKGT